MPYQIKQDCCLLLQFRLREFSQHPCIQLPEIPPRVEYRLSEISKRFEPVLDSLETWGNEYISFMNTKKQQGESY